MSAGGPLISNVLHTVYKLGSNGESNVRAYEYNCSKTNGLFVSYSNVYKIHFDESCCLNGDKKKSSRTIG